MQIGKNYKATTKQFINPFVFSASSFYSGHIRLHISNLTIARIAVLGIYDLIDVIFLLLYSNRYGLDRRVSFEILQADLEARVVTLSGQRN